MGRDGDADGDGSFAVVTAPSTATTRQLDSRDSAASPFTDSLLQASAGTEIKKQLCTGSDD